MIHIFRNFYLDKISFLVGFIAGGLVFYILASLFPGIKKFFGRIFKPLQTQLQLRGGTTEYHYRNDLLKQAQHQHLAHQLFPLDDLIVAPRLLVPPRIYEPDSWSPSEDITTTTIPFLIDWPELASTYNSHTCTLSEAMMGGANLVLIGKPGIGKSITLADFVSQVTRKSSSVEAFHDHFIIYFHICDLCPYDQSLETPIEKIIEVVSQKASRQIQKRLPKLLSAVIEEGKTILLLDGLDELPQHYFNQAVEIIAKIHNDHPGIQIITTASQEYTGKLNQVGFTPVPIATWSKHERYALIEKWENAWANMLAETNETIGFDTALLNSWFNLDQFDETPLELTLKLWASYAGDVIGASPGNEINSYLNRLTKGDKRLLQAMGQIALQMVTSQEPILSQKDVEKWVQDWDQYTRPMIKAPKTEEEKSQEKIVFSARVAKEFQDLIDANIARDCYEDRIAYFHPTVTSFLAAHTISTFSKSINLLDFHEWNEPINWATRSLTFKYLSHNPEISSIINKHIQSDDELTHFELLKIARWFPSLPGNSQGYAKVMRKLAGIIQRDEYSLSLRARVLLAMISTGDAGVNPFIKGMLSSERVSIRHLAALGCGVLQDISTIDDLTKILTDPVPSVHRAACLALLNIGSRAAIDAVAYLLLNGSELQRQAAAEAIANHPIEAVAILKEGSEMDDLNVRRAVVFGLKRIRDPWATEILNRLSTEDKEWVVKDAALHAVSSLNQENVNAIHPLRPPSETPWLLAFAGERGMGISPGSTANDLIILALNEGNEEQRLAALSYIRTTCNPIEIAQIIKLAQSNHGELKESAFNTLWYLKLAGIELPENPPVSY